MSVCLLKTDHIEGLVVGKAVHPEGVPHPAGRLLRYAVLTNDYNYETSANDLTNKVFIFCTERYC